MSTLTDPTPLTPVTSLHPWRDRLTHHRDRACAHAEQAARAALAAAADAQRLPLYWTHPDDARSLVATLADACRSAEDARRYATEVVRHAAVATTATHGPVITACLIAARHDADAAADAADATDTLADVLHRAALAATG